MQDSIGRVETEVARKYNFGLANMLYNLNHELMPGLLPDIKEPATFLLANLLVFPEIAGSQYIVKTVKNTSNDGIKPKISDQLLLHSFYNFVELIRLEQPLFLCSALLRLFDMLRTRNKQLTVAEATSIW